MNNKLLWITCFALLLNFFSCSKRTNDMQEWMSDDKKIKVLSTTQMINDVVKQVGGEYIAAAALIKGELDPHTYQLVKGDDEKFSYADLIFYNGLGLEHGPSLQHHLQGSNKAIALGDKIFDDNPSLVIHVNGKLDPHIWMDISLWAKTVPFIVDALSKKDPIHAEEYRKNGAALLDQMMKTHQNAKEILGRIPSEKRFLVTSHDAFNYFTRAYLATEEEVKSDNWQMRFAAPEGLAPESQLSTTDIKYIIAHVAKYNIEVIFPESNVSRDSIKKIVQAGNEQGLHLRIACCPLYGDAMGQPGSEGDTYLKMITYDATTIAEKIK